MFRALCSRKRQVSCKRPLGYSSIILFFPRNGLSTNNITILLFVSESYGPNIYQRKTIHFCLLESRDIAVSCKCRPFMWKDAVNTNNECAGCPASKAFLSSVAM